LSLKDKPYASEINEITKTSEFFKDISSTLSLAKNFEPSGGDFVGKSME